ncbi:MAG: sigma-70 family RNA polymerase sigma factor [Actinomycetales bacterium]|nr:sigma-70 family RNA polymerase sigma factor [Actinomycetales bacterium]
MGDAVADFTALYGRYLPAIGAYLARRVDRADVEDLAADVFAVAWRRRERIPAEAELPWLYKIAGHLVANHRRRLASRASVLARLRPADPAPGADALLDDDPDLAAAWGRLGAREREILGLVVLDDLPVGDAAVAFGITANAASIRLHRAKKALAAGLERERLERERLEQAGREPERSATPAT